MKILVCGDRNWTNLAIIRSELDSPEVTSIVHGGARGADRLAGEAAVVLNLPVKVYPANWALYGRRAGPIRNREQFNKEKPDLVLAFHNHIEDSKGTKNMVEYAKAKGCLVKLVSEVIPTCSCCLKWGRA